MAVTWGIHLPLTDGLGHNLQTLAHMAIRGTPIISVVIGQ